MDRPIISLPAHATLTYRLASAAELEAAAGMRGRMLEDLGETQKGSLDRGWRERFKRFYKSLLASDRAAIFFAELDGLVVGCAMAYLPVTHRTEIHLQSSAYVNGVYVIPELRRHGIASRLTSMAVEWARAKGCTVVRLRTSAMGRPVYQRLGFRPSEEMEMRLEREKI